MFNSSVYKNRRQVLLSKLLAQGITGGVVVFLGNKESSVNYPDNAYHFRQDSNFLYFFGLTEPNLAACLDIASGRTCLFINDISIDDMVWTGPRPDAQEYVSMCGVDYYEPRASFTARLRCYNRCDVHFLPPYRGESIIELSEALSVKPSTLQIIASIPLIKIIVSMREIKESIEIERIEEAVNTSIEIHESVISAAKDGASETEMMAIANKVAYAGGGMPSFPAIATTRGSILHNHGYENILKSGGLFLLDSGAETIDGYAGDLTSTFPIGKKYNDKQKAIYEIVLKAGQVTHEAIKPGVPYSYCHFAAARVIADGLKDLGILKGDTEAIVNSGAVACFFPHGIGHQMGLDVHDMEGLGENYVGYAEGEKRNTMFGYKSLRMAKELKPGMIVTVEPGIYFISGLISSWRDQGINKDFIDFDEAEKWLDVGGIRNEEDWLVTEDGGRVLGRPFDKSIKAMEERCKNH